MEDFFDDNPWCVGVFAAAMFVWGLLLAFWPDRFGAKRRVRWSDVVADGDLEEGESNRFGTRATGIAMVIVVLGAAGLYFKVQADEALDDRQAEVFGDSRLPVVADVLIGPPEGRTEPVAVLPYAVLPDSELLEGLSGIPAGTDLLVISEELSVVNIVVEETADRVVVRTYADCTEAKPPAWAPSSKTGDSATPDETPSESPSAAPSATAPPGTKASRDCSGAFGALSTTHLLPIDLDAPLGSRRVFDGSTGAELAVV